MQPNDHLPLGDEVARPLVLEYLHGDAYTVPVMPKLVRPGFLVELLGELDAKAEPQTLWRAAELVGYYHLPAALPPFLARLDDTPRDSDCLSRATAIVTMAAWAGDDATRALARDAFDQLLLRHPSAVEMLSLLLQPWTALGPALATGSLRRFAERQRDIREAQKGSSEQARIAAQRVRRFVENDLPRAEAAMALRREIAGLEPEVQRQRILRIYTGLDRAYTSYLQRWSTYWLLDYSRAGQAQRLRLARDLQRQLDGIDAEPGLDKDGRRFFETRALRAIELFNPKQLTPDQQTLLDEALERGQDDPISIVQPG